MLALISFTSTQSVQLTNSVQLAPLTAAVLRAKKEETKLEEQSEDDRGMYIPVESGTVCASAALPFKISENFSNSPLVRVPKEK